MGLYNIFLSGKNSGLFVIADNAGNTINSNLISELVNGFFWFPWHWQRDQIETVLASNDPFSGDDVLITGSGSDTIDASDGDDFVFAGAGNDTVFGGRGSDLVFAGAGDDTGIFATPNTTTLDRYFGGSGNDTLVLKLSFQAYKLAETEILQFAAQLDNGQLSGHFMFENLGLEVFGWENLEVSVAPVIQSGETVELTEPIENGDLTNTVTTSGALQFSDDAFSQHTLTTSLFQVSWSGGDVSDSFKNVLAASFSETLTTGQSASSGLIDWSFSIASAELDFLANGETLELSFQVSVNDGALSDSELVTIIITGTNDVPVALDVSSATSEDALAATFELDFSDLDVNDAHSVSFASEEGMPVNVTNNGDGTFTYFPKVTYEALAVGETATEVLVYTVTDTAGATSSALVTIVIEGQNDAPELQSTDISGLENSGTIEVDLSTLGSDVDSDNTGETLTYSVSGSPQKGIANIVGHSLLFETGEDFLELNAGEIEEVLIEITATDSQGTSVSNIVTIIVEGTNNPDAILTAQDLSSANLDFEFEGFGLDTGEVVTSDIPGLPLMGDTYDFTFAYNGNFPTSDTNAVVFQNQISQTPVEIAFIDETSLLDLTQSQVDQAAFTTSLIDQQFESDDTILVKTQTGAVYAMGNSSENDQPGQDFSVDFDYALISAPVSNDALLSQTDVDSASLAIETEAFDLDTGTAEMSFDPLFLGETADFKFAYNGSFPAEQANSVVFQNQFSTTPVEIAFLDEISLFNLSQNDVDQAVFTTGIIDQQFENDDTILVKTQTGDIFAIGNSVENDLPGQDFTVNFDYANLTELF